VSAATAPASDVVGLDGLPELLPSDQQNLLDLVQERLADYDLREEAGRGAVGAITDEITGRRHLSNNSIGILLSCPQKYGFSYDARIEPISKSEPLKMGSAFQKGIEAGDPRVAIDAFVKADGAILSQADEDRRRINATICGAAALAYLEQFGSPDSEIREFGFRVRLRNPWTGAYSRTFDLLGFLDALDRDEHGHLVNVENKFVGQIGDVQVRKLPLDRQIALGCYGAWRALGEEVTQVRYRFVRKPSIRQKQGESVEEFCERVRADYAARPDFYVKPEDFTRSAADLVRTEAELWEWADKVRRAEKRRLWDRNTAACHEYGGCDFLPICVGDPDAMSLYQRKDSPT
jgi:hypothetical protein